MTFSVLNAQETDLENTLFNFFSHAKNSIDKFEKNKIYLKEDKIILDKGHIYITDENGNEVALPEILSDENGLFITTDSLSSQMVPFWICSKCTKSHNYKPKECERCGATVFLERYRAKRENT